ncbi:MULTISPECIES: outer membrane protein assembly factor BamD [unclassified Thioalkalivibrio]|uniref:outer membrane protein assembly factor BamD n=1 Tax=unclassified Thioalkalivibrio TaxID=2621013 RepID=UPI0003744C5C|nr:MULTISPECIES: outer membrane protein assembly factor BamD [unclassified Thioalkalivibrio]
MDRRINPVTPEQPTFATHGLRLSLAACALFGLTLTGCATTPPQGAGSPPADIQNALDRGECRAAYDALDATDAEASVDVRLSVARVCLQRGEFTRTRNLADAILEDHPHHPDIDYAAYLGSLAQLGTWNRASSVPPKQRSEQGRQVFLRLAAFLNDYPMSEYTESVAPRLARLRENLAEIELQIADQSAADGNQEEAHARTEYVRDYYPGTAAAKTAADRLQRQEEDAGD